MKHCKPKLRLPLENCIQGSYEPEEQILIMQAISFLQDPFPSAKSLVHLVSWLDNLGLILFFVCSVFAHGAYAAVIMNMGFWLKQSVQIKTKQSKQSFTFWAIVTLFLLHVWWHSAIFGNEQFFGETAKFLQDANNGFFSFFAVVGLTKVGMFLSYLLSIIVTSWGTGKRVPPSFNCDIMYFGLLEI